VGRTDDRGIRFGAPSDLRFRKSTSTPGFAHIQSGRMLPATMRLLLEDAGNARLVNVSSPRRQPSVARVRTAEARTAEAQTAEAQTAEAE
jgi:hypothetical protein